MYGLLCILLVRHLELDSLLGNINMHLKLVFTLQLKPTVQLLFMQKL